MVLNCLFNWFHLKLIMQHHFKHSFWDIFINDFKPTCKWKWYCNRCSVFFIFSSVSFLIIRVLFIMRVFYLRIFHKFFQHIWLKTIFTEEFFINKHPFKTVRYVTLSLTVIDSERGVDTDFITLFFVSSVRHQLEDIFLWKFLSQAYLKSTDSRRRAINGSTDVILRVYVFKNDFVTERDVFASFLRNHGFELLLFSFGPLQFLLFALLIHFIIDLKGGSREYLE